VRTLLGSKMKKIILASGSPRRKEILEQMGLEFEIIPSDFDEILESPDFTYEKIEELAYYKAKDVIEKITLSPIASSLVLSADTVVVLDGEILGKPLDMADAKNMLTRLSGKKHSVVTSICAIETENLTKKVLSTTSYVEFKILGEETINNYVENFNPLDKAGSYGIQELPDGFIHAVEGSFENIIGLCPLAVKEILGEI